MKKINIFSIIIILSSYIHYTIAMELNLDLIEEERNLQFSFVLQNVTSSHRGKRNLAHSTLLYLAHTGYEPAICYIQQNNLFIQQKQIYIINQYTPPIPSNDNRHYMIDKLINHILNDQRPTKLHEYYLANLQEEAKKGNLKAAYCLQEMGFKVPDIIEHYNFITN